MLERDGRQEIAFTERLKRSLTALGYELGAFLARRRGQLGASLMSRRELEVLELAARGLTAKGIASELVLSTGTVRTHLRNIYAKLGVHDRAAAVANALRQGLIT